MNRTYFDTETDGINSNYSQILTIYAKALNPEGKLIDVLDESCAATPHRIFHPKALLTNGYPLELLRQNQTLHSLLLKSYDFFRRNGPSLFIAHNANFDFKMLHNANYQNLIGEDIYQLKNPGNALLCSMQLSRTMHCFSRDNNFYVEKDKKGVPLFNLPSLAKANGIKFSPHDAEEDVGALQKLIELIEKEDPDIFNQSIQSSIKRHATQMLLENAFSVAVLGTYNAMRPRAFAPIAISNSGSDAICVDLSSDISEINTLSPLEMSGFMGNKIGKNQKVFKLPLNKSIVLLDPSYIEFCEGYNGLTSQNLFRKASMFRRDTDLKHTAIEALRWHESGFEQNEPTVEQLLYQEGFPNPMEKSFIRAFNLSYPEDKLDVISAYSNILSSSRFIKLAHRLMLHIYPEHVSSQQQSKYFNWCYDRIFKQPTSEYDPKWMTIYTAWQELEKCKSEYPNDRERISEIAQYYDKFSKMMGFNLPKSFKSTLDI